MFWWVNTPPPIQDRYLRPHLLAPLARPLSAEFQLHSRQMPRRRQEPRSARCCYRGDRGWAANDNGRYELFSTTRKRDGQGFINKAQSGDDNKCEWVIKQVFSKLSLSFAITKPLLTMLCFFTTKSLRIIEHSCQGASWATRLYLHDQRPSRASKMKEGGL